jgi:hypothetical protein
MSYRKRGPIAALASVQEVMRTRLYEGQGVCAAAAAAMRYSSGDESSSASCASKGKPFADPSGRTSRGTTGGHCT